MKRLRQKKEEHCSLVTIGLLTAFVARVIENMQKNACLAPRGDTPQQKVRKAAQHFYPKKSQNAVVFVEGDNAACYYTAVWPHHNEPEGPGR